MMRRVLSILGVLVVSGALAGCIQITGNFPAPAGSSPTTVASSAAATQPVTHGVVGEKLSTGGWTVTVEDARRTADSVGGTKPTGGSEFLVVGVGFENKGTAALDVRPEDFELVGPQGKSLPKADVSQAAFNARSMRSLLPRFGTSTVFVFEVPKGAERYAFVFTPEVSGHKTRLEWRVP
jgi:hypothetical protein